MIPDIDGLFAGGAQAVLFDGDCGFCQAAIDRLERLRPDVRYVPFQSVSPQVLDGLELDEAFLASQMLLLSRGGQRYAGADAFNELLRRTFPWGVLARLARVPVVLALERAVYAKIAANRHRISAALGLNRCRLPGTN